MESFVDLSYRGLSLGRRVKLTQVRPSSGYLETPAPMPVGTSIAIATDEGHAIDAVVTSIHEQVSGSATPPGMTVTPALAGAAQSWWAERATLPEAPAVEVAPAPAPAPPVITRVAAVPMTSTDPMLAALAAASQTVQATGDTLDGRTAVMEAVADPDEPADGRTVAMAAVVVPDEVEADVTSPTGVPAITDKHHAIVDDGRATTVMMAVDPEALGLSEESEPVEVADRPSQPVVPGSKKSRRKKRG